MNQESKVTELIAFETKTEKDSHTGEPVWSVRPLPPTLTEPPELCWLTSALRLSEAVWPAGAGRSGEQPAAPFERVAGMSLVGGEPGGDTPPEQRHDDGQHREDG